MTELGVFGVTIRCHPGLDPGSVPRTNNLDAQRRSEEPVFPKDGSMVWDEGRLFTTLSGFSAFKRASVLMLSTWNRQLATVLARAAEMAARSATVLMFCITCVSWLFLPLLAVTGLSLKLRLAPRSGTGGAFTGGDDSRLLTGLRKQTGCSSLTLP